MQAWRSTLILFVFWILIFVGGGYYMEGYLKADQKALQARNEELQKELKSKQELVAKAVNLQETLGNLQNLWVYRSKSIPTSESAHQTYEYLDKILSREETTLNFDFIQGDIKDSAGVHSATYKLMGESKFEDFYAFVWYLEHLPPYLRINSVKLEESGTQKKESTNRSWVSFELSLTAISADLPGFGEVEFVSDASAPVLGHDPFHRPAKEVVKLPANTRRLPNVFESTLQAMTPTQAYITDQTGDLKVLNLGDEVYLGYLFDILPDENRVVFYLNQMIPPRKISLYIGKK
jgi:Tfp pilus assembly protein PilO